MGVLHAWQTESVDGRAQQGHDRTSMRRGITDEHRVPRTVLRRWTADGPIDRRRVSG